jgi:uncharacterized protein
LSSMCVSSVQSRSIGVMWKTVSEDCNLACDYCYYSNCKGKPGAKINRIDSSLLEKFIREFMKKANGSASFAWQGGEPLLAGKDFFKEVVTLQAKHAVPPVNISNALQTNGTLIDEEWACFFKTYSFLLGVSLDGPLEIHDARRLTGSGKGSFDQVMKGIGHLHAAGVDFNILTVIHEGNVTEVEALMEFYQREGLRYIQFIPCMDFQAQETGAAGEYRITPQQYGDFLCEAFDYWYNGGNPILSVRFFDNMLGIYMNQEAELCIHRPSCPKTLILEQNGDAYPCDFYIEPEYKLGNVGGDSLDDILSSPVYVKFLDIKPELPSQCVQCSYLRLCHGGCPRNRSWIPEDKPGVDYFCNSYQQIYAYAHERMAQLAYRIKSMF